MKMIEVLKEEMNKSLKENQEGKHTQCKEVNQTGNRIIKENPN